MKNVEQYLGEKSFSISAQAYENKTDIYFEFTRDPKSFVQFIEDLYIAAMGCDKDFPNGAIGYTPDEVKKRLEEYSPMADITATAAGRPIEPYMREYENLIPTFDAALSCFYGYNGLIAAAFTAGE